MKRKLISCFLILTMSLASSLVVCAEPKTMADGGLFDAEFYANTYADVKQAFGTDESLLYNHYISCGKAEGRLPYQSEIFDAEFYANTYPDVKNAFGLNKELLYNHYITCGKAEGRLPHGITFDINSEHIIVVEPVKQAESRDASEIYINGYTKEEYDYLAPGKVPEGHHTGEDTSDIHWYN